MIALGVIMNESRTGKQLFLDAQIVKLLKAQSFGEMRALSELKQS